MKLQKIFYPLIPRSWRICSKHGKDVGSQASTAWGELKEGLRSQINLSGNTAGRERIRWEEMLCLLPAAWPSAAEGAWCVSGCSPPLTTKDLLKRDASGRTGAEPSSSPLSGRAGAQTRAYWRLASPPSAGLLLSVFPSPLATTTEHDYLMFP